MLLFNISVRLRVEPLNAHAVCNSQHTWAITRQCTFTWLQGVSNLIVSVGPFTLSGTMQWNVAKALKIISFVLTDVHEQCYDE